MPELPDVEVFTRRHSKHLFAWLDNDDWLMLHFGMTGWLKYFKDPEDDPSHARLLITFENGYHLVIMAGVGNIYSDEILFQARVHPGTGVDRLDEEVLKRLFEETQRVLRTAIVNQADPEKLPGSFLLSLRREGEKCPRGNGRIERIKASGRTAYFCPACQPQS